MGGGAGILTTATPAEGISLPKVIFPPVRQVDDGAALFDSDSSREAVAEQGALAGRIVGCPRGVAERSIDKNRSRWIDPSGDGAGRGEADRGESGGFDVACDQTDRLVTYRSNRDEQDEVGLLRLATLHQQGGGLSFHAAGGVDAAHKGVGVLGEPADHTLFVELA